MSDIIELLKGAKPLTEREYKKRALAEEVLPMIENWGFDKELQKELELNQKQSAVLKVISDRMHSGKGAIIAMVGERGLGKSSVAAQFAISIAWKNWKSSRDGSGYRKHVIYRKCSKLIARYKPLFADYGSIDTESLLLSMDMLAKQQEFLVIDELHECDDMKFKRIVLTDLIDRRYAAMRPTILIANQTADDFANTIGDSILSRLNQYGVILPCKWPSFRVQAR